MAQPTITYEGTVQHDWVDYNGHMRDGYYVVVFSSAIDTLMDMLGMDEDYRERTAGTLYTLEIHCAYLMEVSEGEAITCDIQIIDCDTKRMHLFCRMLKGRMDNAQDTAEVLATEEIMLLHVNQNAGPSAAPFPPEVDTKVQAMWAEHQALPRPEKTGASIGIRRKKG